MPTTNDQGPTTILTAAITAPTGYILLMLMLFIALLAIAAGVWLQPLPFG